MGDRDGSDAGELSDRMPTGVVPCGRWLAAFFMKVLARRGEAAQKVFIR